MKIRIRLACVWITVFTSALRADDDQIARMLRKADEILEETSVVSNRAVNYGGDCPEANWALSVICASKDPVTHLLALSKRCHPAGFVMCLLGVRVIDQKRFDTELASQRKDLEKAKLSVQTAFGCFWENKPALKVLDDDLWTKESILCDPIPELWATVGLKPFIDDIEAETNQLSQPKQEEKKTAN